MTRRRFLRRMAASSAGCLAANPLLLAAAQDRRKPNIVLLYSDDVGWTDLGCFGSGYYETSNLDRLCSQGVKFTSAYSSAANCAPARACLLTGQYVPRHGVYTVGGKRRFDSKKRLLKWNERKLLAPENAKGIPSDKVTIAEALKEAGYTCGHFGKWHVGGSEGQLPGAQGFDTSVQMKAARHFKFRTAPPPKEKQPDDAYLSDYLADQAVQFIETNQDRPFFLYFSDFLVHVPLEGKQHLVEKYRKKEAVGGHHHPVYAAMIEALDYSCCRIIDTLDRLGLADNTLVLFYSDNGGCGSAKNRGLDHTKKSLTSVYPLRGMKGMLYEGGIRVPLIARWPGVIESGSTCEEPVIGVDLFPTFLDAASAQPAPQQILDGESFLPVMSGRDETLKRTDIHWWMPGYLPGRQAPAHAMRSGDYKIIEYFEDGNTELFNLREDIGERNDLAAKEPETVRALHKKLKAWRNAVGAKIPERNPNFDPKNEGRW